MVRFLEADQFKSTPRIHIHVTNGFNDQVISLTGYVDFRGLEW